MLNPLSVSELNNQIKALLETTFSHINVEGEVSNLTYHNSGHIYFSIKDENSTISCVMFRGNAQYLKFRLEVGQKINITGSITVYAPRGNYQLLCSKIQPSGIGELALAYEQLKNKLQTEGYFDLNRKKTLPKYPKTIVIVTSGTGAAIEDMKKVATHRWPLCKFILIPTLVQGEGSKEAIVQAIKKADTLKADIMIVGRGGGSIEDLWAFNEESVANAIFQTTTPVISAVGHEIDYVISDFVADVRAATPSNAMEIALPDMNDLRIYMDGLYDDFKRSFLINMNNKTQELNYLHNSFKQNSFANKFKFVQDTIVDLNQKLSLAWKQILNKKSEELTFVLNSFTMNNPDHKIKRGFVQTTKENVIIDLDELKINDIIDLESTNRVVKTKVLEIKSYK